MLCYKAILQYDGSLYQGFQVVHGAPTIQGELNLALARLIPGEFTTRAASRTDKGVHALAQVIKISSLTPLTLEEINQVLPASMRCLGLTSCPEDFIPSMDQISKEYRYLFCDFPERYIAQSPSLLNLPAMQECARLLEGRHDFKNFWSIGGVSNSTIRQILSCEITNVDPRELFKGTLFSTELTDAWQFRIVGTGFLKHMVRHLVGSLWLVGSGTLTVLDFKNYLHGDLKPQRPWKKADPRGLYLFKVNYK